MRRRLLLRPVERGDLGRIYGWRRQTAVAKWMFSDHEIGQAEHARWIDSLIAATVPSHWVMCLDDLPVGVVNLAVSEAVPHRCSLGIYVAEPSAHGSGAGTAAMLFLLDEAFERREFEKLTCEAFSDNTPALRLYESVGFKREGMLRSHVKKAGRLRDVAVLSMLRLEYEDVRPELLARVNEKIVLEGAE